MSVSLFGWIISIRRKLSIVDAALLYRMASCGDDEFQEIYDSLSPSQFIGLLR